MSEPEWGNATDHEISRRTDVNPFRGYPVESTRDAPTQGTSVQRFHPSHGTNREGRFARVLRAMVGLIGVVLWLIVGAFLIIVLGAGFTSRDPGLGGFVQAAFGFLLVAGCVVLPFGALADWLLAQAGWRPLWNAVARRLQHLRDVVRGDGGLGDEEWRAIDSRSEVDYRAYLQAPEWQQRRRFMLNRFGDRCQVCNGSQRLQIHHRTYAGSAMSA